MGSLLRIKGKGDRGLRKGWSSVRNSAWAGLRAQGELGTLKMESFSLLFHPPEFLFLFLFSLLEKCSSEFRPTLTQVLKHFFPQMTILHLLILILRVQSVER